MNHNTDTENDGMGPEDFFLPADEEHVRREKAKARELRKSQWWKNVLARGCCRYCGKRFHPRELTMDHVVPIIRGGRTTKGNVAPCCKDCNNRKKYYLPSEWHEYLDSLAERGREGTS
jgi:5-methylcytosine-specific restriction endonuclease McrA